MRNINFSLIFLLFTLTHCKNPQGPEFWSDVNNGLRVRIWTDKTTYREGEDVWLHVEFENVSIEEKVILVDGPHSNLPESAPSFDINKIIILTEPNDASSSIILEITTKSTNMFNDVPDLLKLKPGQLYRENTILNSGFWHFREEYKLDRFTHLGPGRYKLQAIYAWTELPQSTQERINKLEQLGAPLWNGYLESNEVVIIITEN